MFSLDFTSYWVHFALLKDSVRFFTFHLEVNDVGLALFVNIILDLCCSTPILRGSTDGLKKIIDQNPWIYFPSENHFLVRFTVSP